MKKPFKKVALAGVLRDEDNEKSLKNILVFKIILSHIFGCQNGQMLLTPLLEKLINMKKINIFIFSGKKLQ